MSASGSLYKWSLPLFLLANALSAWYMIILDCDETFNYLEPLHHMIYGYGLQTWEYSPRFALRPYSFLLIFAGPIRMLLTVFSLEKVTVFKLVRLIMGTMSAFAQKSLVDAVADHFGQLTASYLTVTLACSTGFFIASSAFLPNTFAMILFMHVLANWMRGKDNRMLMMMSVMGILSWPYALLCCIIPALVSLKKSVTVKGGTTVEMSKVPTSVQIQLRLRIILLAGLFSIIYLLIPTLFVEHSFYGRWTFPSLNAVLYNVAGRAGGPDLFGTEPWYFYLLNLGLNFSFLLPAALVSGPFGLLQSFSKEKVLLWANMALSLMIFSLQKHKEERFLFILYPLICLNASLFMSQLRRIRVLGMISRVMLLGSLLLSLFRTIGLISFYRAPQTLLESIELPSGNLCMENSWYRFPGSFYLSADVRPKFIKGSFNGQLPIPFKEGPESYRNADNALNGYNRAIPEQFISPSACTSFMGTKEEFSRHYKASKLVQCGLLNDAQSTRAPYRWLWLPGTASERRTTEFCVWNNLS